MFRQSPGAGRSALFGAVAIRVEQLKSSITEGRPTDRAHPDGTARFVASIRAQGLLKGSRRHVHLSADEATATKVGQRHGKPVVLVVQAGAMHREGRAFFLSENGVWLTEHVPPEFVAP